MARRRLIALVICVSLCFFTACGGGGGAASVQLSESNTTVVVPITFETTVLPGAVLNDPYTASITVTGGAAPIAFTVVSGSLPSGISLSSAGTLSGTPASTGTFTFTIQAAGASSGSSPGATASQQFTLAVTATVAPLSFVNTSLPNPEINQAYMGMINVTGGLTPYTFTVISGSLPAGMQLITSSSEAGIAGTPTQGGTFTFTLQARDSSPTQLTAAQQFTITVGTPLAISTSTLPAAFTNVAYSSTVSATGGSAPYSFSISSGALPTGLTLGAAGLLTGTPTQTGTFNFTVKVTDSSSPPQTVSMSYQISATTVSVQASANFSVVAPGASATINAGANAGGVTFTQTCGNVAVNGGTTTFTAPNTTGPCVITVTSVDDPTKSAQMTISAVTLSISSLADMLVGTQQNFTVSQSGSVAAIPLTFSVTGGQAPQTGASGTAAAYVAPSAGSEGTYTVTASSANNPAVTATTRVNVISLGLSPAVAVVSPGGSQTFTATVKGPTSGTLTFSAPSGGIINPTSATTASFTAPNTVGANAVSVSLSTNPAAVVTATVDVDSILFTQSPPAAIATGASANFAVTVSGPAVPITVTTSPSGGTLTLNADGLSGTFTAPMATGIYNINAAATANAALSATANTQVIWLTIACTTNCQNTTTAVLTPGSGQQTANFSVDFGGAPAQPLTYSVNTSAGTLTPNGSLVSYTADTSQGGNFTITAAITANPTVAVAATVKVAFAAPAGCAPNTAVPCIAIPVDHPRLFGLSDATRKARALAYYNLHPFTPAGDDPFNQAYLHVIGVPGQDCSAAINWSLASNTNAPIGIGPVNAAGNTGSDSARDQGEEMILVYDWCYDVLNSTQKASLISAINAWIQQVEATGWIAINSFAQSNYYVAYLRNDIEWGIASYGDNGAGSNSLADDILAGTVAAGPQSSTHFCRWLCVFLPWAAGGTVGGQAMFTEPYANTNGQGGFLEESPGYGASLADYPIIPFVTENFLGRDMYSETQYFKSLAYFVLYNTLPAPTYNKVAQQPFYQLFTYADDSQYVDAGSELKARNYFQNFMLNTAEYYPSIPVGQYARQWYNTIVTPGSGYDCHDINADSHQPCGYVAAQDTGGVSLPYSSLPLDYYSSGYMISRTAWDTSSAVARWQMNYPIDNEHSHYDAGSFDIWRRGSDPMGRWLTRESAGYSNIFNGYNNGNSPAAAKEVSDQQLLAHNTLLIDGKNAPTDDDNKRAISVNRLQSSSGFAYADVDLSNLYKSSSGSNVAAVVHVEREFLYLRGLETLLVFDRLEVQSPDGGITPSSQVIKSFLLHAETNPVINDNQHVTVTNGNEVLHVTTLLPSSSNGYRVVDESNCADCSKDGSAQFRVELDDSGGVNSLCNGTDTCSYFLHVLQARDQSATDIAASVVDDGTFFTVTLQPNGQNATTIVLNKGMTSSGGSVNIANSGAISLQPGLQSITYGDGGPVWH